MSTASNSNSTTSLLSTTVSSRTPLNGSSTVQPKDFQSAFATLQSTYGFSGSAPSPVSKSSKTPSASSSTASLVSNTTISSRAPLAPKKDFQSAFTDLQSTYGFGGAAPSPVPSSKQKQNTGSLFSKFIRSSSAPKAQGSVPSRSPSTSTSSHKVKVRHIPRPTPHMTAL
ncbi:hypothetical protein C8R43DRAFT_1125457 [Mycena crocata]|nr:hypothetical protein C8R43DRAFT_1125457 [Mycena crocata]